MHRIYGLARLWRHSSKLHRAYSLFFLVGTSLAVQVPVVAWTPLRSLEQLGPLLQLLALQVWEALAIWQRNSRLKAQETQGPTVSSVHLMP